MNVSVPSIGAENLTFSSSSASRPARRRHASHSSPMKTRRRLCVGSTSSLRFIFTLPNLPGKTSPASVTGRKCIVSSTRARIEPPPRAGSIASPDIRSMISAVVGTVGRRIVDRAEHRALDGLRRHVARRLPSPASAHGFDGAVGERGDGQRGIDAERGGNDGAVEDEQAAKDRVAVRRRCAVEHLSPPVDDAAHLHLEVFPLLPVLVFLLRQVERRVAHRTSAERMHGQKRPALAVEQEFEIVRQQLPHRIGLHFAGDAGIATELAQRGDALAEDLEVARIGPAHADRAVAIGLGAAAHELERAARAVVAHDREQRRAPDRPAVDRARIVRRSVRAMLAAIATRELAQRVTGAHHLLEHAAQRRGHRHFLDDDRRGFRVAQVDDAGDRRSDLAPCGGHLLARDRVHLDARSARTLPLVVGNRDHVAVGGEALAKPRAEDEIVVARAQQDFGRAEGAGGENHLARDQPEHAALAGAKVGIGVGDLEDPGVGAIGRCAHGVCRRRGA